MRQAFQLLLQAHEYACSMNLDSWDFAVELACLEEAGLTRSDVRWLSVQGYLLQAEEIRNAGDRREFRSVGSLALPERSCFVLTAAGVQVAQRWQQTEGDCALPIDEGAETTAPHHAVPRWDAERRALFFGGHLIKRFKLPAANQEIILQTFEEDGWPFRIDDPLPKNIAIDPKRRLHNAINSLNRNQRTHLLHFLGDGTGEGLCWEPCGGAADCNHSATRVQPHCR
jgi:hypothetical protein